MRKVSYTLLGSAAAECASDEFGAPAAAWCALTPSAAAAAAAAAAAVVEPAAAAAAALAEAADEEIAEFDETELDELWTPCDATAAAAAAAATTVWPAACWLW